MPIIDHSPKAATVADILAPGPDTPSIPERWQKYFERLNRLREELASQRHLQVIHSQNDEPTFGMSPADSGTDEYDIQAAMGMISSEQNALYEIDQALRRMEDGSYGICEATGQEIPAERLEAIPWTRFARDVEEKLERDEQARKPKHVF